MNDTLRKAFDSLMEDANIVFEEVFSIKFLFSLLIVPLFFAMLSIALYTSRILLLRKGIIDASHSAKVQIGSKAPEVGKPVPQMRSRKD